MCALSLYCTPECSPSCYSSTKYWLCTHYFFSLSTFSPHRAAAHLTTPRLPFLPRLTTFPSSLTLSHPASPSFPWRLSSYTSPLLFTFSLLHHRLLLPLVPPPFSFLLRSASVSSSLQRGKAVSPSPRQWPIESCWAPISLLIGWAGLSRYWEEGLALLASCLSAYLSICLPAWPSLSLQQGWPQICFLTISLIPSCGAVVIEIPNENLYLPMTDFRSDRCMLA